MINRIAGRIRDVLLENDERAVAVKEEKGCSTVSLEICVGGVEKTPLCLEFISRDDSNVVFARVCMFDKLEAEECHALLQSIKEQNADDCFLWFFCDNDNAMAAYSFSMEEDTPGEIVMEIINDRFIAILDEVYPILQEKLAQLRGKKSDEEEDESEELKRRMNEAMFELQMAREAKDPILVHVCEELKDNQCSCGYVDGSVVTECRVHGMTYNIWFTHQEDEALSACLPALMHVPADQRKQTQELMWLLNRRVMDVRFEFDEKNNVNLCYDFPEEDYDPADEAFYVVRLITDAARIAIPLLEKELTLDPQEDKPRGRSEDDMFGSDDLPFDDGDLSLSGTASVRHEGVLEAIKDELDSNGYDSFMIDHEIEDRRELLVSVRIQDEMEMISFSERKGRMAKACLFNLTHLDSQVEKITIEALLLYLDSKTEGLCFICDEDGDVHLCYDYPDNDVVGGACDLVERFIDASSMARPYLRAFLGEDRDEGPAC